MMRLRTGLRAFGRALLVVPLAFLSTLTLGSAATASQPRSTPLFASPSGVASLLTAVLVVNHASSTLTIFGDEEGTAPGVEAGVVSHKVLGITGPTTIVTESFAGHALAFVASIGGKVSELQFRVRNASTLVAVRTHILVPRGCTRTDNAYLTIGKSHDVVEVCQDGVVTSWGALTGKTVWRLPASTTKLTDATGIATNGSQVAVTNMATSAAGAAPDGVTLLSLTTHKRILTVTNASSAAYGFAAPEGIAWDGKHFWVVNTAANTVDVLSSSLAFLGSAGTNLSDPGAVVAGGGYAWVASQSWEGGSSMVTQFQLVDGLPQSQWMMCNTNGPYEFDNPVGLALSGMPSLGSLWVTNVSNGVVDEMVAASGTLIQTFS